MAIAPDFTSIAADVTAIHAQTTDIQTRVVALASAASSGGTVDLKPVTDALAGVVTQITALNAKVVDSAAMMTRFDAIDAAIAALPASVAAHLKVGLSSV